MTTEDLEKNLERWKRVLLISIGIVAMLMLFAIYDIPKKQKTELLDWYCTWAVFQVFITPPGFVLLISKFGRSLPTRERINTAFGYFTVAWLALLAFGIQTGSDQSIWYSPLAAVVLVAGVGGSGVLLALSYWLLRRIRLQAPDDVFP